MALSGLGLVALLTLAYVLIQCWNEYHALSLWPSLDSPPASLDLKEKLASYRSQAEDLQRLVSLLIAFSSLYTIVLGASTYFSAKEGLARAKELEQDIEQSLPFFKNMGAQMFAVKDKLERLMPDSDERTDYYHRLDANTRQDIERLQQSAISWLYFLDFSQNVELASDIYRNMGKYYGAKANSELEAFQERTKAANLPVPRDPATELLIREQKAELEAARQRARFFLVRAIELNPNNFVAYNDLAYLTQDIEGLDSSAAEQFYLTSARLNPAQQRAYYNLALIYDSRSKVEEAERVSGQALRYTNWQLRPNAERNRDVLYNRACYRSRLAGSDPAHALRWFNRAEADLRQACSDKDPERAQRIDEDTCDGGDLENLFRDRPKVIAELRSYLVS